MMTIGVTGGSGFIGSHLTRGLVAKGYRTVVLDKDQPSVDNALWHRIDLLNYSSLEEQTKGLDTLYHLAAIADASYASEHPLETVRVNTEGTANVLEACRKNDVDRIVYASTIWVYNASERENVDEETLLSNRSRHIYTTSKLTGEFLCQDFHDQYGLDFTILRFGIPYGPGGRFNVIPVFIKAALLGQELTIRGSGEQRRPFIYAEDLAEGCIAASSKTALNRVYNISGSQMISVNEIVSLLSKLMSNVHVQRIPERKGEIRDKIVSISRAEKELNWKPRTSFEIGFKRTFEWYRNDLGRGVPSAAL
jgi:UDP-glucose 4-epimerase